MSSDPPSRGDGGRDDGADPFADLTLDESFVASASISEPTAEARERAARAAKLERLLADKAAQRANREHEQRRFAPAEDWDEEWGDLAPTRRPRRGLRLVALLVVLSVALVYVLANLMTGGGGEVRTLPATSTTLDVPARPAPDEPTVEIIRPDDWPPPPADMSSEPLGEPAAVPDGGGPHEFILLQPDGVTPVAYDPCRPIHFVTRRDGAPPEGDVLIREAVGLVSAATGLRFVDDGATDEAPSDNRAPYQSDRYGERWAPVLFTWSDSAESPRLGEVSPDDPQADPAGYAGSVAVGFGTEPSDLLRKVFVTGSVTLDREDLGEMLSGVDGRSRVRAIIAHEVGHLVGLGHIDDPTQLMYPTVNPSVTSFAPGDLEGLAALGGGDCFPDI